MAPNEGIALAEEWSWPAEEGRSSPAPVLDVVDVRKTWRGADRPVLDGIDLSLRAGIATWIGGDNGAGKTTLLRVIAGLIKPDSGSVRLMGLDVERQRRDYHRRIGFLSAGNTGLFNRLTVRRHLDYWARLAFIPRYRRGAAVEESLARFDLRELADRRVERMSMGQRQRVRLAMAFLHRPELLILDEARTSLDAAGVELLHDACTALLEKGGTILACSPTGEVHEEVRFDRRFVLRDGALEAVL